MSKGSFFLKTGVTSANFKFSGNSLFDIALLKSNYKVFAVISTLCRRIFGWISLCAVASFGFKPLISFLMSDSIRCLKRKVLVFSVLFLIIEILGWNWYFTMIFSIRSWMVLCSLLITNGFSFNFNLEASFSKKLFNVSATFSSFWIISSLSVSFRLYQFYIVLYSFIISQHGKTIR